MQIDLEHLHYWMCAIRESTDPKRTLDAFWRGQLLSKEWLITNLQNYNIYGDRSVTIDIYGGWVGTLASMLFMSNISISKIQSIDIDPTCEPIAKMMNKQEDILGKFIAITADMCDVYSNADIIINTSCEHITQDQYDIWLNKTPNGSLLILQSNNYDIPEHIRISKNLEEFKKQSNIEILWEGELELPLYKRFMIIGKKRVSK